MKKLMNYSTFAHTHYDFSEKEAGLTPFLSKHSLDGVEMMQYADWDAGVIPAEGMIGNHTCFWPIWLDYWRRDEEALIQQFGSLEASTEYYGFSDPCKWVAYYRDQLERAKRAGVRYVLFHVSHVELEHCYTYRFTYSDREVVEGFIDFINQVLEGFEAEFEILFENHWWPGLTFMDPGDAAHLLEAVKYSKTGFVLDVGHLMNTRLELRSEKEAVTYIHTVLDGMGDLTGRIRGMHLNSSLSGAYVTACLENTELFDAQLPFEERHIKAFGHIGSIDRHIPFSDAAINEIIQRVSPEYLVYEFMADTLEELDRYIALQNDVLELGWSHGT